MTELKTFVATIGRRNDTGFQIDERPGVWLNISRFSDPPPVIPPVGTIAQITVDEKHFVRAIEPQEPPSAPRSAAAPAGDALLGMAPIGRDVIITRLAVLKAAARFLADKPNATSVDVELVAAKWERWVTRTETES